MTIQKIKLSGSTYGRGIKVGATATPGTLVHTSTAVAGAIDEVFLFAQNNDTVNRDLTIEYGGTTSPDDLIKITLPPASGLTLVVPGLVLSDGQNIRALASAANVVVVHGYVNRIDHN